MRIFLIFFSLFLLSACSLPGTETEATDTTLLVEKPLFSLMVPKTWTEANQTTLPNPKNGTIELAYISPEVKYGFSNNIVVMANDLPDPITSKKYSELNQLQTSKNYLEYTKLTDADILFSDDEISRVTTFEARYNETAPRMKFVQTAKVCGKKVYLIHLSLSLDKDPSLYIPVLQSFQCK